MGNLTARSPGRILLMTSLMAVLHVSHLVGLASTEMSTPAALRGHATGEMRSVSPQPTVPPVLLPPAGSPPKLWGPRGQFLAVVNTRRCRLSRARLQGVNVSKPTHSRCKCHIALVASKTIGSSSLYIFRNAHGLIDVHKHAHTFHFLPV